MFSRTAALVAAGVLVMSGLATGTAHATAADLSHTVRIVGNYDNGNHGYWASLAYSRTVRIAERADTGVYDVVLADRGTFRTLPGSRSPQAGERIRRVQDGTFDGAFSYVVRSEVEPTAEQVARFHNFRCNPRVPNRGACPGMDQPTSNWPALYFPQGAKVEPGAWRWEYRTCAESWVNGSAGNRGDITGERCERREEAAVPTVVQPECGAEKGKLTIPANRGVYYKVRTSARDYRVVRAGEYNVRPGIYRVRAEAKPGVRLVGERRWTLVVETAEACPTPTPTPTATDEPTPTPDPSVTPTDDPTEEPEPQPTVTETRTNTRVIVIGDTRVPDRVDTGAGWLANQE